MGFASMLEDIVERLGREIPTIVLRNEESEGAVPGRHWGQQAVTSRSHPLPTAFEGRVGSMLAKSAIPSYLILHYTKWIYLLVTKQGSIDDAWGEFVREGVPLLTQNLHSGDPLTKQFVARLMR